MNEQDRKLDVLGPPPILSPSYDPSGSPEAPDPVPGEEPTPPATLGMIDSFFASDKKESDRNSGDWAKGITESVSEFATKLSESLNAMLKNMSELEVFTYVSMKDLNDDVIKEPEKKSNRIAFTRIKIDGDIESSVPTYEGDVDEHLWRMHLEMVERAQNHRVQLIRTLTEAAIGLLHVFK